MYVSDMMEILGLRLEDAGNVRFSNSFKRSILELSQIKLSNMLDIGYLTELEYLDASKTATAKVLAFSSLTYPVLKGKEGILKVKISGGKYCTQIDINDLKRTENSYLEGTDDNPLFYVFKNTIYILCTTTNPVIDVYYLRLPPPLLYPLAYDKINGVVTSVANGAPEAEFTCTIAHGLSDGDVVTNSGFSESTYNATGEVTVVSDYVYWLGDIEYVGTGTGVFTGLNTVELQASQDLSAVDNYYNGALFYNITKNSYHVATDYTAASQHLVFYPAIAAPADDQTIYMLKHTSNAVEITNLEALEPLLNPTLHELIIDLAEAECWKSGKKGANVNRMATIIGDVFKQIQTLNEKVRVE